MRLLGFDFRTHKILRNYLKNERCDFSFKYLLHKTFSRADKC